MFAPVSATAERLRDLAEKNGVSVAKAELLSRNYRSENEALRVIEAGCFRAQAEEADISAGEVTVAACADLYAECAFAAREIHRLLRTQGGHFRDFAVVVRSTADYEGVLDAALEKAGIAYYMDRREDLLSDSLPVLALSALRAAERWETEDILRLLKTGLTGCSPRSLSVLENYVFYGALTAKNGGRNGPGIPTACLRRRMRPPSESWRTSTGCGCGRYGLWSGCGPLCIRDISADVNLPVRCMPI